MTIRICELEPDLLSGHALLSCPSWIPLAGTQVINKEGKSYRVVLHGDAYPENGDTDWINLDDGGGPYIPNPNDPGTQGVLAALIQQLHEHPRFSMRTNVGLDQYGSELVKALTGVPSPPPGGGLYLAATVAYTTRSELERVLEYRCPIRWAHPGHFEIYGVRSQDPSVILEALKGLRITGWRPPLVTC